MAHLVVIAILMVVAQVAAGMDRDSRTGSRKVEISYCGYEITGYNLLDRTGRLFNFTAVLYRLPRNKTGAAAGQPVLLQHGLFQNGDSWFQLGKNSLPCLLAEAGYDVWVAHARGTLRALMVDLRRNITLTETVYLNLYSDFSFHDLAINQLPPVIDKILAVTKKATVSYVGNNVGGTMAWVLLSTLPEYNKKVNVAVNFAPVCHLLPFSFHSFLLRYLAKTVILLKEAIEFLAPTKLSLVIEIMMEILGLLNSKSENVNDEFILETMRTFIYLMNGGDITGEMEPRYCLGPACLKEDQLRYELGIHGELGGRSPADLAAHLRSRLTAEKNGNEVPMGPLFSASGFDITSFKNFYHVIQLIHSAKCEEYQTYSPFTFKFWVEIFQSMRYKLERITTPQFIIHGPGDYYLSDMAVRAQKGAMKRKVATSYYVNRGKFGILDYQYNEDAKQYVYDVVLRKLASYLPPPPPTTPPPVSKECLAWR